MMPENSLINSQGSVVPLQMHTNPWNRSMNRHPSNLSVPAIQRLCISLPSFSPSAKIFVISQVFRPVIDTAKSHFFAFNVICSSNSFLDTSSTWSQCSSLFFEYHRLMSLILGRRENRFPQNMSHVTHEFCSPKHIPSSPYSVMILTL
jgi:hypothetical protein